MLQKIKTSLEAAFEYLVVDTGIEANIWRNTQWLKDESLPPHYGIVSTNISESSNAIYEDARKLPWLYCVDSILNHMSPHIATLCEKTEAKLVLFQNVVQC
jgi:hypothetical protein